MSKSGKITSRNLWKHPACSFRQTSTYGFITYSLSLHFREKKVYSKFTLTALTKRFCFFFFLSLKSKNKWTTSRVNKSIMMIYNHKNSSLVQLRETLPFKSFTIGKRVELINFGTTVLLHSIILRKSNLAQDMRWNCNSWNGLFFNFLIRVSS